MISSITGMLAASASPASSSPPSGGCGFDAAMQAANAAASQQEAHRKEMAAIAEKGFSAWVRDTRMEKLKEELRKTVMAEMGMDPDQMSKMDAVARQLIEQKIEEEITRRMEQAMQEDGGQKPAQGVAQLGKNVRSGPACPVIPALIDPGGESLF
jgi:hypothetical protein